MSKSTAATAATAAPTAKRADPRSAVDPEICTPMPRAYIVPEPVQRLLRRLLAARIMQEYWTCKGDSIAVSNWMMEEWRIQDELLRVMDKLERFARKNLASRPAHACLWLMQYICDYNV